MNQAILIVSSDLTHLEQSHHRRHKSYFSDDQCQAIDQDFKMQASLLSTLFLQPVYNYILAIETIYARCDINPIFRNRPEEEQHIQQATRALHCMCQFAAGLRYLFHVAFDALGGGSQNYNVLLQYFNQTLLDHRVLSNIDVLNVLTKHTQSLQDTHKSFQQIVQRVQHLQRATSTLSARSTTRPARLNTGQRETIRSERSIIVKTGRGDGPKQGKHGSTKKNNRRRRKEQNKRNEQVMVTGTRNWTPSKPVERTVDMSGTTIDVTPLYSEQHTDANRHQPRAAHVGGSTTNQEKKRKRLQKNMKNMLKRALKSRRKRQDRSLHTSGGKKKRKTTTVQLKPPELEPQEPEKQKQQPRQQNQQLQQQQQPSVLPTFHHNAQNPIHRLPSLPKLQQQQQQQQQQIMQESTYSSLATTVVDTTTSSYVVGCTVPAVPTTVFEQNKIDEIFPESSSTHGYGYGNNGRGPPVDSTRPIHYASSNNNNDDDDAPIYIPPSTPLDEKAKILLVHLKNKIANGVVVLMEDKNGSRGHGNNNALSQLKHETRHYDESLNLVSELCSELTQPLGELVKTLHTNMKHANSEMHFAYTKEQDYWNKKKKMYKSDIKHFKRLVHNNSSELKILRNEKMLRIQRMIDIEMKLSKAMFEMGDLKKSKWPTINRETYQRIVVQAI
jgi:hypothetical protein